MRRLVAAALGVLALVVAGPPAGAAEPQRVVVVGVPGLVWSQVDGRGTPELARLAARSAVGSLSVKAVPTAGCLADAWLTLGAGNRARAVGVPDDPCTGRLPPPSELPRLTAANDELREGAQLGALSAAVQAAGGCVRAVGPGAELALTTPDGRVPRAEPGRRCPVEIVDAGPDVLAGERLVGRLVAELGADTTLLVVGLPEAQETEPRLHVAVAAGARFPPASLVSGSTRRAPYVQLVDVAPTVLDLVGLPRPAAMTGQPWRSSGEEHPGLLDLAEVEREAAAHREATVPFFVVVIALLLLGLGAAAVLRSRRIARATGLVGAAVPGASYLAGLAPGALPLPALLAAVALATAVLVAVALAGPWRRWPMGPVGAVCALSALVVLLDLVTGAHLQLHTPAGYSALVAGRFAGLGNVAFGVLAASLLIGTAALAAGRSRTTAGAIVAACGLGAVLVTGAPSWGSDVGGVLALLPGFVLLGLLLTGARVSVGRLALAGAAAIGVVGLLAVVDLARAPEERTHLGRFAADLTSGEGGDLLRRKAEGAFALLFHSPVTALLPVLVAVAAYLLLRPPPALTALFARAPAWRAALLSTGLTALLGLLVNDSGAAVPALALLVAVPAVLSGVAGESLSPADPATK